MKKIAELELEKKDLYTQINSAIEDSIATLKKYNDTESLTGLKYIEELKNHLKELNYTENKNNDTLTKDQESDLKNRRKFNLQELLGSLKKKKVKENPFDFEQALTPKKVSEAELKKILQNRIKMQKKLDEWIKQRQKEKDRLAEYRLQKKRLLMSGIYEKCPRFGYSGNKKTSNKKPDDTKKRKKCKIKITSSGGEQDLNECLKNMQKAEEIKSAKTKISNKRKYPCCRKCCKKSYMGCL
ncbi:unnamed protein product [Danaus chrysippus]|uniref:(African queen) hypothetical protein n=1 Tax=Danaus chrysippus TaxID=151541 RepID=A0A8J2W0D8_9NEOP|nr:unnamed protein product [Danaus chrysippus]